MHSADGDTSSPVLTIAIPTFDRPAELAATLAALAPQLDHRVRLVVLDNASPVAAETVVADLGLGELVTVIRHPVNVGLLANVMRCFEVAETPWLWLLSDDDDVLGDAAATILDRIQSPGKNVLFAFPAVAPPGIGACGEGWIEFLESGIRWTDILFLPVMVYATEVFREHVRHGYYAGLSGHIATLRAGLGRDGSFEVCNRALVNWVPGHQAGWITESYMLWAPLVLDTVVDDAERERTARALAEWPDVKVPRLARRLFLEYEDGEAVYPRYLLDQIYWRFQYYGHGSSSALAWIAWRTILARPRLLRSLRSLMMRTRRRGASTEAEPRTRGDFLSRL